MSGFWSDAFDNIGNNLRLVGAAVADATDYTSWVDGRASRTAAEVERQKAEAEGRAYDAGRAQRSAEGGLARIGEAAAATAGDVAKAAGKAADKAGAVAGGLLDALMSPWVLAGLAVVVGLVVAAPYVAPVLARKA
jgi:hypothetical protein